MKNRVNVWKITFTDKDLPALGVEWECIVDLKSENAKQKIAWSNLKRYSQEGSPAWLIFMRENRDKITAIAAPKIVILLTLALFFNTEHT